MTPIRLDGQSPARDNAKSGDYNFVYNATMQWNKVLLTDADKKAFLINLRANGGKASALNIADVDTQQGVLAAPSTYPGAYDDLTDPVDRPGRTAADTARASTPAREGAPRRSADFSAVDKNQDKEARKPSKGPSRTVGPSTSCPVRHWRRIRDSNS